MKGFVPDGEKYSDLLSDEDWLTQGIGETPHDIKDDELFYLSQN